jgi:uncharacterized small protein (DUF1192 family)
VKPTLLPNLTDAEKEAVASRDPEALVCCVTRMDEHITRLKAEVDALEACLADREHDF